MSSATNSIHVGKLKLFGLHVRLWLIGERKSSIHSQHSARNVRSLWRTEKQHACGNFFRLSDPTQGRGEV